jgi:hypothetical protein
MSDFTAGMVTACEGMLKVDVVLVVVSAAIFDGDVRVFEICGELIELSGVFNFGWSIGGCSGIGSLVISPPGSAVKSGGSM